MTAPFKVCVDLPDESRPLRVDAEQLRLPIAEVLCANGILLNTRCGQQGVCDGCELDLRSGAVVDIDTGLVTRAGAAPTRFRACRSRIAEGETILIRAPRRSLAAHEPFATSDFRIRVPFGHDPMFSGRLAAAVDVGTTSITVAILDLEDGALLSVRSARNAQSRWGQDVLSRIAACQRDQRAVSALQEAVCRMTICPLIGQCLEECGLAATELSGATVAGNTVMLHLLAGEDPTPLGRAPFETVFTDHRVMTTGAIGFDDQTIAGDLPVHLLPSASAYVGADIVAGAVATGLAYVEGPSVLLDLGTNGEILLKHGRRTLACAAAAGPAFEGAGLTHGATASRGAISSVRLAPVTGDIQVQVIGGETPTGVCGSAYVDLLADGRRAGLINRHGRLKFANAPMFAPLRECVNGETALRVAADAQGQPIVLTEGDVAALLQAKAAIAAGVITLLKRAGVDARDVREAFVAGAFGTQLDPQHATDIGLLPAGVHGHVEAVGNASLAGAYMLAVDRRVLEELERCASDLEVVELNLDAGFESRFVDQLLLP